MQVSNLIIGIAIIFVGLFEIPSFNSRNIYIGIAAVLYGIGTISIATQKKMAVKLGIAINFIVVMVSLTALLYEKLGL